MAKLVAALVGGIGSGKSTVAQALARRGGRVIVADALGHEALRRPDVIGLLVARWGRRVLTDEGTIDRRAVAGIVFANSPDARTERKALEAIVFPHIERRLSEEIAAARADAATRFVVLDAAVLLEAGWDKVCDRVVYVHAPRAARLRRLTETRGWSAKEVDDRERAQWPLTDKATRADDAVDNAGPPDDVTRQVDALLTRWGLTP